MKNYWSCSKLADAIRGTAKPNWATCEEWDYWDAKAKESHPFRYWFVETGLDAIQKFVRWPIDTIYDIKYYCLNRWVTNTHQLTASAKDIKRGEWCDVGYRFLPCLFNELVDFVEVEIASHQLLWLDEEESKKYKPPFWSTGFFKTRTWRSAELGMNHLKWASELTYDSDMGFDETHENYGKPTPQALGAMEIIALYIWWKFTYPARQDAEIISGLHDYHEARSAENGGRLNFSSSKTPEERAHLKMLLAENERIEQMYRDEDTEMMIRLIKVRDSLWT